MKPLLPCLIALGLSGVSLSAANSEIAVVASIKPVHSLVAAVMNGAGVPGLIVKSQGSEHVYTLRPSQAAELEKANLVFWIGPEMETFLVEPFATLASKAKIIELMDTEGLLKLPLREGGAFEADAHKGEEHDTAGDDFDAHVWLDPQNAKILAAAIARALAEADPANAARYNENAEALLGKLDVLTLEVQSILLPVAGKGFIVFHDAYHYFENRFGIAASGSITVNPDVTPGVERIVEIRGRVSELGATCVFSEPQFSPNLVSVVVEGTEASTGVLDPLGAALPDGPELYFDLIRDLAVSLRDCLAETN